MSFILLIPELGFVLARDVVLFGCCNVNHKQLKSNLYFMQCLLILSHELENCSSFQRMCLYILSCELGYCSTYLLKPNFYFSLNSVPQNFSLLIGKVDPNLKQPFRTSARVALHLGINKKEWFLNLGRTIKIKFTCGIKLKQVHVSMKEWAWLLKKKINHQLSTIICYMNQKVTWTLHKKCDFVRIHFLFIHAQLLQNNLS